MSIILIIKPKKKKKNSEIINSNITIIIIIIIFLKKKVKLDINRDGEYIPRPHLVSFQRIFGGETYVHKFNSK